MPQNVELNLNFDEVQRKVTKALHQGMMIAGEHLRNSSIAVAPEVRGESGGLIGTAFVEQAADGTVTVGYTMPYAARLHEHPEYDFRTDVNPNAQGKYLEEPANQEAQKMLEIAAEHIRRQSDG
ncbi:MAG: hypothetical protein WBA28_02820 [Microbacteriaceae bacterium]